MTPSLAPLSMTQEAPRRRGVRTLDEIEASSPTGRALHALEGVAYSGSQQAIYYRTDRELRLSHDQRADAHVFEIERDALTLLDWPDLPAEIRDLGYSILANARGYFVADEHEDAAAAAGDGRVELMHGFFKRIASWCERSCVALRERARGGSRG